LDIETAPNVATIFSLDGMRHQSLSYTNILSERYILTAAWQWYGHRKIFGATVRQRLPHDDFSLVKTLARQIERADVIIGHWAMGFDFPWIRGRLLFHKLPPMAPATEFDTCRWAQRVFYLNSCKLDYLAQYLGFGAKQHTDHELWQRCLLNDHKAFARMLRYNKHDVWLLEKVFKRILPHVPPAINRRLLSDRPVCPTCGSRDLQRRGLRFTRKYSWQRLQCRGCGAWHIGEKVWLHGKWLHGK
jgi:hypothetical protein